MHHASFAPLEHLFDSHEDCGTWCKRKQQLARQEGETTGNNSDNRKYKGFYRSKEKDAQLHEMMKAEYEIFQRKDVLEQSRH
eukprot:11007664-Ditylum_brightwellii.AAC.1